VHVCVCVRVRACSVAQSGRAKLTKMEIVFFWMVSVSDGGLRYPALTTTLFCAENCACVRVCVCACENICVNIV
jgi:hypothetical protein